MLDIDSDNNMVDVVDCERQFCAFEVSVLGCLVVNYRVTESYYLALTNQSDDGEIASEAACEGLSNLPVTR